jgi:hypothetical protein
MRYVAIRSEGGLIPYDLLDKIASEDIQGQKPSDFGLPKGRRLTDEISRVWSDAQSLWDIVRRRRDSLSEKDPYGTTLTRERWIVPLLSDRSASTSSCKPPLRLLTTSPSRSRTAQARAMTPSPCTSKA